MTKFTIIIPTHDHEKLLECALDSALTQTEQSWELFVIADGSTDYTHKLVEKYQKKDHRIKLIKKTKGPRNGEIYRDQVIREQAKGKFICYLSDDDLFFPDYLEQLENAFDSGCNFVNTVAIKVTTTQKYVFLPVDLSKEYYKELLLRGENRIPLSNGAHTRKLYLQLKDGWRTTPQKIPTDLYMWQQFLESTFIKPKTLFVPSVLNFASPERVDFSKTQRFDELKVWLTKIKRNPEGVRATIYRYLLESIAYFEPHAISNSPKFNELNQIYDSKIGWLVKVYFKIKSLIS